MEINTDIEETNKKELENKQLNSNKFWKYFWGTIVVLIFIYTIFGLFAIFNTNNKTNSKKSPIIEEIKKEVIEIVETDKPNSNLSQNQKLVLENLKLKVDIMNNTIEEKINKTFEDIINKNIDAYLDYHYSLLGSYMELGAMALNDSSEKLIKEKLLGVDFDNKIDDATKEIIKTYKKNIEEHQTFINNIAVKDVDLELNKDNLNDVKEHIEKFKLGQESKIATIGLGVGSVIGAKIVTLVMAKITAKTAIKTGAKVATKVTGVGGAATAGGLAGLACGPGAFICSPIGAIAAGTVAWFGTDIAINKVDEAFNREELKNELLTFINKEKQNIKNQYASELNPKINAFSEKIQTIYKEKPIKEKKKVLEYVK